MFQENAFPRSLLFKAHDLSEYLGHIKNVSATIDIKIANSHFYFSVDRSYENTSEYQYMKRQKYRKKTPSDYKRDYIRKNNYQEKQYQKKDYVTEDLNKFNENLLLECSFISDCDLPEMINNSLDNECHNDNCDSVNELQNDSTSVENMDTGETLRTAEFIDPPIDKNSEQNVDDNSSKYIEAANYKNKGINNDKLSQVNNDYIDNKNDSLPKPISPLKSPDQSVQFAKKSKKKKDKQTKTDVHFYMCAKNDKSAERNVKSTLNDFDLFGP